MSETCISPEYNLGILRACEQAAESVSLGRRAFSTWCHAQMVGWDETRKHTARTTMYRYLKILRAVGVPVPRYNYYKSPQEIASAIGWLGVSSHSQRIKIVTESPSRIVELIDKRFRVTDAWNPKAWPDGSTGSVEALVYDSQGWSFTVEMDYTATDPDPWPNVAVSEFLTRTEPEEVVHVH